MSGVLIAGARRELIERLCAERALDGISSPTGAAATLERWKPWLVIAASRPTCSRGAETLARACAARGSQLLVFSSHIGAAAACERRVLAACPAALVVRAAAPPDAALVHACLDLAIDGARGIWAGGHLLTEVPS